MKNRKIGTLTLAFILIGVGVLMLSASFTDVDVYKVIYYVWPLALIMLGLEIIFKTLKKEEPIKFDIGAFILTFLVLLGSAIFFLANYIGIIDKLKDEVNMVHEYIEADLNEIKVDDDIEKIYLDLKTDNVVINSREGKTIDGRIGCYEDHGKDEKIVVKPKTEVHKSGNTMYISISRLENYRRYIDTMSINLPSGIEVSIQGNGSDVTAYLDEFDNLMKISEVSEVKVYGAKDKHIAYREPRRVEEIFDNKSSISSKIDENTDLIVEKFDRLEVMD